MGDAILMKRLIRNRKGQGTLEIGLVFIVMACLLYGLIHIWFWGNRQIVMRQIAYNNTRIIAGKSHDFYLLPVWPVYMPPHITKEEVLVNR